ncbi:hypothetical protein EJB05_10789, partial [Eragrostis curvula]
MQRIRERRVDGARESILQRLPYRYSDEKVIYVDGWNGLAAVPILRSIAQEHLSTKAHPPELCFDKIIYVDCSLWESRRMMQRKIAEELKLDLATMEVFDKMDDEDDFSGVDRSSRDVIQSVAALIHQTLVYSRFMVIFLNGSDDEIDVTSSGIPMAKYHSGIVMWTFNRRLLTIHHSHREIQNKLKGTHIFIHDDISRLSSSEFRALLHEEATSIVACHPCMQAVDLTMVTDCCLYKLFLHNIFHRITGFDWTAHASNYWMCANITKRDIKSEIVKALDKEIHWKFDGSLLQELFHKFNLDLNLPFLEIHDNMTRTYGWYRYSPFTQSSAMKNYYERPYDWVCITTKYQTVPEEDVKIILEWSSSLFIVFQSSNDPPRLPSLLFKYCRNLAVVTLSFCSFSFVSPPFLECQTIKFLGLEHCTDSKTRNENYPTNWAHLHSFWVLDLRNTDWDDILSEEKLEIMDNLMELNIEGAKCWQYLSRLKNRLPCLERLRIIKPTHEAARPTDTSDSFMNKKMLQILDLSGNKDMKNLPTGITNASNLEVLVLDGCNELENVLLTSKFHFSLRSFSFDGYGPTTQWKSMVDLPPECSRPKCRHDANKVDFKTLKISLQGFKLLENLFLRGLLNLVELDLSGSTIKVLDFNTMVVDVPNLKRLFLLGCEHLHAIRWVSTDSMRQPKLEFIFIDTRSGWSTGCARPSLNKHKSYRLQVHAIIVDAMLVRSLYSQIKIAERYNRDDVYFNISITNSGICDGFVQENVTSKDTVGPTDQPNLVLACQYGDVSTEIGDAPSSMEAFPEPPLPQSDRRIEIGGGGRANSEMEINQSSLARLMMWMVESLNVHDSSDIYRLPSGDWWYLRWCRVARCPKLDTIFPTGSADYVSQLESIWASDLLMARCIWSKGPMGRFSFGNLQHLHLCFCPRLQFVLPVWIPSFRNLRTLHITHCGNLEHVFVLDGRYLDEIPIQGVPFSKLTTILLYDLPKLRQISEHRMLAPALETIRIRGCFALQRLPSLEGRAPGMKRPVVEMEKDIWNALEWDGLAAGHHPGLFEPPVHSRHYRRRFLKGTILRGLGLVPACVNGWVGLRLFAVCFGIKTCRPGFSLRVFALRPGR